MMLCRDEVEVGAWRVEFEGGVVRKQIQEGRTMGKNPVCSRRMAKAVVGVTSVQQTGSQVSKCRQMLSKLLVVWTVL